MENGRRLFLYLFYFLSTLPLIVIADKGPSTSGNVLDEKKEDFNSKKQKGIKELIYQFSESYPEATKYLKNEKNVNLNNPAIIEKISLKDIEKMINDYISYQLNTQRKLNSSQDKKNTVSADEINSKSAVQSNVQGATVQASNQNDKDTSKSTQDQTSSTVEVTFDKNELLMGKLYGISCPKNTVHNVLINNKPLFFKLPERLSNNTYFKDSKVENSENLSCGRFSTELTGTFKVKCNSGVLSVNGDCKPSGCQEGLNVSLSQWDVLSYNLNLDKKYPDNSYVRDSKNMYASFDNGEYLSCKRFDSNLEGHFKLKCESGALTKEEVGCSLINNADKSCVIDSNSKKVVCTKGSKKNSNFDSNVNCAPFYRGYDVSLYTNIKPPYRTGVEVNIQRTDMCEVTVIKCNSNGSWEVSVCASMPSI
ncbi:MAG: hypothetical protein L6Q37_11290 [Bdellovibrionaceae bacterium]|nr:hypothetical protein [Pseudobdellovibrionaceae bacterium]